MKYDFSREEIFKRAFKITDRIQKRMNEYVNVKIVFPDKEERRKQKYPLDANFSGNIYDVNKSEIEIVVPAVYEMFGKNKLRSWNAALTITIIHEMCHWIIFKQMSIKERKASNACYEEGKAWGVVEETHAWVATLRWLKKLRYHRSPTILKELHKFVLPEGFKWYPPFCKERKNAKHVLTREGK